MDNYQFCADFARRTIAATGPEAKILDFGCGAGKIVTLLRNSNVSAFGCDSFYGGAYGADQCPIPTELSGVILPMQDNLIPFPDCMFDVVLNNQVMEHVENLDTTLAEIYRVLKPGGIVLSLFPDKGVWREGHCGVPFLHWFPKRSKLRIYYAFFMRIIGFGYFGYYTKELSRLQWSKNFCKWLDDWTVYRSYREISETYGKYFLPMQHIEERWLESRLGTVVHPVPVQIKRLFVNKMAGMVFTCAKAA